MKGVTKAALYMRLSKDDEQFGDSISIETQEIICQGGFHPNTTSLQSHGPAALAGLGQGGRTRFSSSPYSRIW